MPQYKIRVDYNTGDSFHSEHNVEGWLEPTWTSLEIAKENLQRIKEHYEYYDKLNNNYEWRNKSDKEIKKFKKEISKKVWFAPKYEFNLMLKTDEGKEFEFSASLYCGYFERLNSAEIIDYVKPNTNTDRKVYFH